MTSFMTGNAAPGVHVAVNTAPLARSAPLDTADAFFAAGYSVWGPIGQATHITGLAECQRVFGGLHPNSHLGNAVALFFREGGTHCVISRVVGAAAAVATLTRADRAGAPLATLRFDAKYPSSTVRVYVTIEAGEVANTVKLTARTPDLPLPVEVHNNVKLTFTQTELDAIAANASPLVTLQMVNERSSLIKLTNLNSATAAPNNLPALMAETLLTGGSDDFASLDAAAFIASLDTFASEDFGTGQVALPGITTTAAHQALAAHAALYKRFAIGDLPPGTDSTGAITARQQINSPYMALYWPPTIQVYDLAGSGVKKMYPTSGAVAGVFARAEREVGVHKAPANYQLFSALDVERAANGAAQTGEATRALLNNNEVNVITPLTEEGIKVYGARPVASYGLITAIHEQRVINQAYYQLKKSYRPLVFGVLDAGGRIFREAKSLSEQYLRLLYQSGALTSDTGREDDAFSVVCDASNNPPQSLDQHQLVVGVWMHIVGMAERVFITINHVPQSVSLKNLNL